jgi:hypothetical protein
MMKKRCKYHTLIVKIKKAGHQGSAKKERKKAGADWRGTWAIMFAKDLPWLNLSWISPQRLPHTHQALSRRRSLWVPLPEPRANPRVFAPSVHILILFWQFYMFVYVWYMSAFMYYLVCIDRYGDNILLFSAIILTIRVVSHSSNFLSLHTVTQPTRCPLSRSVPLSTVPLVFRPLAQIFDTHVLPVASAWRQHITNLLCLQGESI